MVGHQDIAEMVKRFRDALPDVVLDLDHSLIAGVHAVYVWTFKGHQAGKGKYAAGGK